MSARAFEDDGMVCFSNPLDGDEKPGDIVAHDQAVLKAHRDAEVERSFAERRRAERKKRGCMPGLRDSIRAGMTVELRVLPIFLVPLVLSALLAAYICSATAYYSDGPQIDPCTENFEYGNPMSCSDECVYNGERCYDQGLVGADCSRLGWIPGTSADVAAEKCPPDCVYVEPPSQYEKDGGDWEATCESEGGGETPPLTIAWRMYFASLVLLYGGHCARKKNKENTSIAVLLAFEWLYVSLLTLVPASLMVVTNRSGGHPAAGVGVFVFVFALWMLGWGYLWLTDDGSNIRPESHMLSMPPDLMMKTRLLTVAFECYQYCGFSYFPAIPWLEMPIPPWL